jgi:hypothetical protein
MLFRPLIYPIPYGYFLGDIPKEILDRYPPPEAALERNAVRLLFMDDFYLSKLPLSTQSYIGSHYVRDQQTASILVRNDR